MRIEADRTKCDGYANCVMNAPDYFDLSDDDGKVIVLKNTVENEGDLESVEEAVRSCPVSALSLHDE